MLDDAMAALRGGDYATAARQARALIKAEPDNAEAYHVLCLALRQTGDLPAAEAAIDRALALAPERAEFHIARAMLATLRNDPGTARAALSDALQQDPNQLIAYVSLAELALAASDLEQAEQHLKFAERINPDHPHVLALRGQALLARGQGDAAMAALTRAGQLAPYDALVQSTLGLALIGQGHFAFAEQALRNALVAQPQARNLRHALLKALLAQGRPDEAETEADTLLAQRSDDPHALTLKGQFAAMRGAREEAAALLTRSLDLLPAQPRALEALLDLWVANNARERAVTFVEAMLQRDPTLEMAWGALVDLHRIEPRRAAETALRWQQARPDSDAANEIAAQIAEAAGEFERASELAARAVAAAPGRIAAHLILMRAELRAGDGVAARARIEPLQAASHDPAARRALSGWLGLASDLAGDPDAAMRAWLEAHAQAGEVTLPALGTPDAALRARVVDAIAAAATPDSQGAPILLWGVPGSGVERVVALLRGDGGAGVLTDRFGPQPRPDGFQIDGIDAIGAGSPVEAARNFARRWRDGLSSIGAQPQHVDWLPHWDARVLPPLLRGLPGARLLIALRDPRDMLLNWIATGSAHRLPVADPRLAAQWLVRALEQLMIHRDLTAPALQLVWVDELDVDAQVADAVARFVGLAATPSLDLMRRTQSRAGGLGSAFPEGHWQRYADVLREPFALLEPIAARLRGG